MVDVVNKSCEHVGCIKQSSFNYEGQKGSIFCAQHKSQGMANVMRVRWYEHAGCSKNQEVRACWVQQGAAL